MPMLFEIIRYTCILLVLYSRNNKIYAKNNTSKNPSSIEIKPIMIQFCKTLSKSFY